MLYTHLAVLRSVYLVRRALITRLSACCSLGASQANHAPLVVKKKFQ